jgi:uncharacterized protein YdgA (DUF945 family)
MPLLILGLPAFAQDAPTAPVPTPEEKAAAKPPEVFDPALFKLYGDIVKDLKRISNHRLALKERIELARSFTFSAETKAELKDQFGNDDPFYLSVEDLADGGAAIHGKSDALDHVNAKTGSTLHIEPITAESLINRTYTGAKFNVAIPGIKLDSTGDLKSVEINDIRFEGDNTVGPYNFMIGKSGGKVGRIHFGAGEGSALDVNDMAIDVDVAARKKVFDERVIYRIASIDWGSDKIENFATDIALLNVDAKSLEGLTDYMESFEIDKQANPAQSDAIIKMFKRFAFELSKHNGVIEIHDLSAQYHGERAGLSGRASLPNLKEGDLDSTQKIFEKLSVRLRVHVPMAMVDDITHKVSRSMMEAQAKQSGVPVTDMAVDLVARGIESKMTDTLVKQQKWVHMEKNELVTVFEMKKGKMYLDGHVVNAKSNPFMAMAQGK